MMNISRSRFAGTLPSVSSISSRIFPRTKSTAPVSADVASSCPFTGATNETKKQYPTLIHSFSLPIFGSLLTDTPDEANMYRFLNDRRSKYGDFYTIGAPGFGADIYGTIHIMNDPNEFAKVVRGEGMYPSGIVELLWPIKAALKECDSALVETDANGKINYGLFDRGERWKKHRAFLQTGMLDPRAAKGFVPAIAHAAELATKGAPTMADGQLNRYLNQCAFDLFSSFMFGEYTNTAGRNVDDIDENDENIRFCNAAINFMELSLASISRSPYEMMMHKVLGIRTAKWQEMIDSWKVVQEIGSSKLHRFIEKRERGQLNETERASYFANALERFEAQKGDPLSMDEVMQLCILALFVAVDTTSTVIQWNLLHLALNKEVQETLYEELFRAVSDVGHGKLTASVLERSSCPYLSFVLRETNRLTPPFPSSSSKSNSQREIEIFGKTFPVGTTFSLESIGNDERFVSEASQFRPERWYDDEVKDRKGSRAEHIDHVIHRDPFGQGARRCPGSRVATNEVLCMISQLVLKYEIRSPDVATLDEVEKGWSPFIAPVLPRLEFIPRV